MTITILNEYITVGVISMDELPLTKSKKILVQTGTSYLPTDWSEVPAEYITREDTLQGYRILNTGKIPWVAQPTRVELSINNLDIKKAVLLDAAGYAVREINIERNKGKAAIILPEECLYIILKD